MSVNDLLLVYQWLEDGLKKETSSQNAYLSRLLSAHLFELGTFLKQTDKPHLPEVQKFLADLAPEFQSSLEMLKAIGEGGTSEFALQLKRVRNKIFHYELRVVGDGEGRDPVKNALRRLAQKEAKEERPLGAIEVSVATGFRAKFADDVALNISFSGDVDDDEEAASTYAKNLLKHVRGFMPLVFDAVLPEYVGTRPEGTFWLEGS